MRRQRGVALLAAVLLVALGTIVAAAIAFQNAMTARRGAAALALDHGLLVAQTAEAVAAYALREDARESPRTDHPAELWGQPFGPVEISPGIVLEASLTDMQGRFNLNSLVKANGEPEPGAIRVFTNLLELLGLETKWAPLLVDWLDADRNPDPQGGAEDSLYTGENPPYRPPNGLITSISELLALPEFGRERYRRLAPHVAALPQDAKINICSASAILIDALMEPGSQETSLIDPDTFARYREEECYPPKEQLQVRINGISDPEQRQWVMDHIEERSSYFRLRSIATIGTAEIALYSLLRRNGEQTDPILRSFSAD